MGNLDGRNPHGQKGLLKDTEPSRIQSVMPTKYPNPIHMGLHVVTGEKWYFQRHPHTFSSLNILPKQFPVVETTALYQSGDQFQALRRAAGELSMEYRALQNSAANQLSVDGDSDGIKPWDNDLFLNCSLHPTVHRMLPNGRPSGIAGNCERSQP